MKKLINDIKQLKHSVVPRKEWVSLSRDLLLQQINPENHLTTQSVSVGGYFIVVANAVRQSFMQPALMMLLVLGVFLGSSLTINAAFYSLPGDNLYSLKIALEKTHVAFIADEEKQVELKIEFAQKRIAELDKIVAQTDDPEHKKQRIEQVVQEFKNNVASVNGHLDKLKFADSTATTADASQTVRMALTVSTKADELAKNINKEVTGLSDAEKKEVEELVATAVEEVQEVSQSAKEIAENAAPTTVDVESSESGAVEGASTEDQTATPDSDSTATEGTTLPTDTSSTVEAQATVEVSEQNVPASER